MAAKETKITGVDKAAILLMNIGEELATEVMKHLTTQEIHQVSGSMVRKEGISLQTGRQVVAEFIDDIESGEFAVQGLEYAKSVISKALGPEKAHFIIDQLTREMGGGAGLDSLKWMDPEVVANMIKSEHPQIIALILTFLEPERASQVLINLPEERVRGEVMMRVSRLKSIPISAVQDLELLLSDQMMSVDSGQGSSIEGVKVAAEIMNQVESTYEAPIMEHIESKTPELAQKIQEMMFVFADLMSIDDRGMQMIIKEVNTDMLTTALKGADEEMMDKFFSNMSERAAEMLAEDLEAKGPVRLSDVEKAQQEIIKVARRLEQEGKVMRAGKGGSDILV